MKILVFSALYLPGFKGGGPIRTLANLVQCLGQEFEFFIVTSDRDHGSLVPYEGIPLNQWIDAGSAKIFYASPKFLSITGIFRLLRDIECDAIYLNSFFGRRFSFLPFLVERFFLRRDRPVLIAPRGELSAGALGIRSWRKKIFICLLKKSRLHVQTRWQVSSDFERRDVERLGLASPSSIFVAPNIFIKGNPHICNDFDKGRLPHIAVSNSDRPLRICFLSRIAPMKNLDYALRVLAKVRSKVVFHIFGPIELPEYWEECKNLMMGLPSNICAEYRGGVVGERVIETISEYDLFFVPTRGENYGHVFIESLSAGVPILLSDQTPWRNLADSGLGWDISLSAPDEFSEVIELMSSYTDDERAEQKTRCRDFAATTSSNEDVIDKSRNMFRDLIKN